MSKELLVSGFERSGSGCGFLLKQGDDGVIAFHRFTTTKYSFVFFTTLAFPSFSFAILACAMVQYALLLTEGFAMSQPAFSLAIKDRTSFSCLLFYTFFSHFTHTSFSYNISSTPSGKPTHQKAFLLFFITFNFNVYVFMCVHRHILSYNTRNSLLLLLYLITRKLYTV